MVAIFRAKLVATPADFREASLQIEKGCDGPIITKSTSWKGPKSTASWSTNYRVLSPWSTNRRLPIPPGQAPSDVDSDMEEASVSSADDSMPGLISESLTPKTSSTTKSRHWRVIVDHLDRCPSFELDEEMLLMFIHTSILLQNRPEFHTISRKSRCMQRRVVSISLQKS
jgi:hypothetical protein